MACCFAFSCLNRVLRVEKLKPMSKKCKKIECLGEKTKELIKPSKTRLPKDKTGIEKNKTKNKHAKQNQKTGVPGKISKATPPHTPRNRIK